MIEREYYPLTDAANMVGRTVDDLLHLGALGRIHIIVLASCLEGMLFDKNTQPVFGILEKINDNYPKMVLSLDKFPESNRNGITWQNLIDFLTDSNQQVPK